MQPIPFIPPMPSPSNSESSYYEPLCVANPDIAPPLDINLRAVYQSLRSRPYPLPDQMSINASPNLSNVSPAESSAPLPFPRPQTPAAPAMSPRTVSNTLTNNPDISPEILRAICNGLLSTIAKQETEVAYASQMLGDRIKSQQDRILHYEETFEQAPYGYTLNDERIPHFRIPVGNGLYRPAKWIKLNDDGTASGYADTAGPNQLPHIIDLYATPDHKYDDEAEPIPALPIPAWFRFLMLGPVADYEILRDMIKAQDDWGLTREIERYRDLDDQAINLANTIESFQHDLCVVQQARAGCESRLILARAAEKVQMLQNLSHKAQATRSGWKRKSTGRGHPV